jgi:hypothetical protein
VGVGVAFASRHENPGEGRRRRSSAVSLFPGAPDSAVLFLSAHTTLRLNCLPGAISPLSAPLVEAECTPHLVARPNQTPGERSRGQRPSLTGLDFGGAQAGRR